MLNLLSVHNSDTWGRKMADTISRGTKIYERVVEEIKELISRGEFEQGDPLPPERQLIEQLGVSRSSLREAFKVLESLGLLESIPGKGRFVRKARADGIPSLQMPLEDEAILELVEARRVLEPCIASEAAKHASSSDLGRIRRLLTATAEDVISLKHRADCDYSFHLMMAEATHNFIFVNIVKMTFNLIMATHERIYTLLDDKEVFLKEHRELYECLLSRDPEQAASVMKKHVNRVYKTLLNALALENLEN